MPIRCCGCGHLRAGDAQEPDQEAQGPARERKTSGNCHAVCIRTQAMRQQGVVWQRWHDLENLGGDHVAAEGLVGHRAKKFEALKMSADYGVREFAQRILSQRSICDALPKSDVNDATQRDVFLKGLPSQLTERVLQKKKSKGCSFKKLVDIAHKYWISLTETGVLREVLDHYRWTVSTFGDAATLAGD
eukprot:COSAG05_NODE_1557_length_4564_cov_116.713102_5_plen_189_part_00